MQNSQGTNPFGMPQPIQPPQIQPQFTGAGFGGYTPQPFGPQNNLGPMPQPGVPEFSMQPQQPQPQIPTIAEPLQPQMTSTNPFRQSMLPGPARMTEPTLLNNPTGATSSNRLSTNPFAKQTTGFSPQFQSSEAPLQSVTSPVSTSPFGSMQQQQQPPLQPLQPSPTGTNPFARQPSPQSAAPSQGAGLTVHATGSTNPFRQSAFVNQQTDQGWHNTGAQGTLGGISLDQVPTTSVFPRPGQQQQQPNFLG